MSATTQIVRQAALALDMGSGIPEEAYPGDSHARGAVFTRQEVVDFILDLVGYTSDRPLHRFRMLEPSFGDGCFLLAAVGRLLTACERDGLLRRGDVGALAGAIRAVELHGETFMRTRQELVSFLKRRGLADADASALARSWLIHGDFLLVDLPDGFTHVVGNPPYVRQELVPPRLLQEYRARYETLYDRADLYVPFIERSLCALAPGGELGFICSDRWMKNKYGGPLRAFVSRHFHLAAYIDMVGTEAFQSDVAAYPAITLLRRESAGATRIAHRPSLDPGGLSRLALAIRSPESPRDGHVQEVKAVACGAAPWILQSFDQLAVVRRLERDFPSLEEAGCKIGIGVATGADRVFVGDFAELDVEPSRKLPLVETRDIVRGVVDWRGRGVINPFEDDGSLASLDKYPRFAGYLHRHGAAIRKRNCAVRNPAGWYRTIDRITPSLSRQPKLLIPDIKGEANVVYEEGRYYPHHNLYYITSRDWDLRALQTVLASGIAKLFVAVYSTRMRGGYLRFQAQYLRRIRIPFWRDVPLAIRGRLAAAGDGGREDAQEAVFELYGLTAEERAAIGGNGNGKHHGN